MKRTLAFLALPIMTLAAVVALATTPAEAQYTCYDSYVTVSGTCPDSCGRGEDCPCYTCVRDGSKT